MVLKQALGAGRLAKQGHRDERESGSDERDYHGLSECDAAHSIDEERNGDGNDGSPVLIHARDVLPCLGGIVFVVEDGR